MKEKVKALVARWIYFVVLFVASYKWMDLQSEIRDGWLSPYASTILGIAMMGCLITLLQMFRLCIYWKDIKEKKITVDEVLSWRRLLWQRK